MNNILKHSVHSPFRKPIKNLVTTAMTKFVLKPKMRLDMAMPIALHMKTFFLLHTSARRPQIKLDICEIHYAA